ncbi:MAG: hypothetical protein ACHRXM_01925 [Isosphaerales bacterium]
MPILHSRRQRAVGRAEPDDDKILGFSTNCSQKAESPACRSGDAVPFCFVFLKIAIFPASTRALISYAGKEWIDDTTRVDETSRFGDSSPLPRPGLGLVAYLLLEKGITVAELLEKDFDAADLERELGASPASPP